VPRRTPMQVPRAASFVAEAMRWSDHPGIASEGQQGGLDHSSGRRVLVADDNADLREYIARLLAPVARVSAVANGGEALEALRRESFDLVLTDVMMPNLSGFELLEEIRADTRLRATPVLMLSARAGEEARLEGLERGADDYIVKPFSARELIAKTVNHLALARARREVREERDRFRELLSRVPAVVNFLVGPDLVFEYAHPLAVRAAGGRALEGRAFDEAFPEHRGQPWVERLRQVYATGEPAAVTEVMLPLDLLQTGVTTETYWNSVYLPVRSVRGEIEGVMTFDLDVTEQVLARRAVEHQAGELEAAREAAERANRAKDEFLAVLGHELRNPLSPIATAAQLLRLRGQESRELAVIERQVKHLTRLVDDLLDVSRVTRGKVELQRRAVDLSEVMSRAVEMASPLLEQRQQHLDLDMATGLVVDADAERLAQVLGNLLTNASKYSDHETRIRVSARRRGTLVMISVTDQGIGIPRDMLDRVFEPFVQQPQGSDRSCGGLGLGLAIALSLVERHGGTIRAESEGPGAGSRFVVELPASQMTAAPAAAEAVPATAMVPRRGKVLIVDDNVDAAELLAEALRQSGYETRVAHDGPTALDLARSFGPAVALLDIGLPVMDGYELGAKLRDEVGGSRAVTLIAVTGYGQDLDRQRSSAAGFLAHLVKPIDLDALGQLLDSADAE
jgi:signal transduction histidine kinase